MNDPLITSFLNRLKGLVGKNVLGIVVYGSCLSSVTKSSTSTPDFFVIVDAYDTFYAKWSHKVLNSFLPPNIYHFHVEGQPSKYSVVSLARLQREVQRPSDMYLVGRFSKKMVLGYAKNPAFENTFTEIQAQAIKTVARMTLNLMPTSFKLEDFCIEAIGLSYKGDVRVESADKIKKLFESDPEHYQAVYTKALLDLKCSTEPQTSMWKKHQATSFLEKYLVDIFILGSKLRAQLRWPKAMLTASDWLDYVLTKIERTQGIKIDLTPRQKKLWFIYGWKYFFLLKGKKLIK